MLDLISPLVLSVINWGVFVAGLAVISGLALSAFDREYKFDDWSLLPRYMSRQSPYYIAKIIYIMLCLFSFVCIITYRHDLPLLEKLIPAEYSEKLGLGDMIKSLAESKSVFIVTVSVCVVYITHLTKEFKYNALMSLRSSIYSLIAIPYFVQKISQIAFHNLNVPPGPRSALEVDPTSSVKIADFDRNAGSTARMWAETAYIDWWLRQQRQRTAPDKETFFAEQQPLAERLARETIQIRPAIIAYQSNDAVPESEVAELVERIELHKTALCRFVATFLVSTSDSRRFLYEACEEFGIKVMEITTKNPLMYVAVYFAALLAATFISVTIPPLIYDAMFSGLKSLSIVELTNNDILIWAPLAFSLYFFPIIGILLYRSLKWRASPIRTYSFITIYSWIALFGCALASFGVTLAMMLFPSTDTGNWTDFGDVLIRNSRWSIVPSLVSVYVNYHLDLAIESSAFTPKGNTGAGRKFFSALGFASVITLASLPPAALMIAGAQEWNVHKLQFIAISMTFIISLSLCLTARFADSA